jgi:ribosomal protein S18 acetylase RimI-like enzyme
VLDLRPVPYDHPDAVRLIAELHGFYRERYGGGDGTPFDPAQFEPPHGLFVVGYADGDAVACGGWRARDAVDDDPGLRDGDAEIKRMYVAPGHRRRGLARVVLRELERTAAAAGRLRVVLETGLAQPEAIAFYLAAGYAPTGRFGMYRHEPDSRCFARNLSVPGPNGGRRR